MSMFKSNDDSPWAIGQIVYIKPGAFPRDDNRPRVVIGHDRGMFGGLWVWTCIAGEHHNRQEPFPISVLTPDDPPHIDMDDVWQTRTGKMLRLIDGGRR